LVNAVEISGRKILKAKNWKIKSLARQVWRCHLKKLRADFALYSHRRKRRRKRRRSGLGKNPEPPS
jgi:hypothetical protein